MNESQSRPKLWLLHCEMARLGTTVALIITITQHSRAFALPTMPFLKQLIFINLKSCLLFVSQICEGWRGWNAGGWWVVAGWWVQGWCFGEGVNGWDSGQTLVKSTTESFKAFSRSSQLNARKSYIINACPETEFQGTPFIKLP